MLVTIAGIMAMRRGGFGDQEHRASNDRREFTFFARNDHRLIASAEEGAAGLVEKHWADICRLSDYLVKRHGGSIDGPSIEALLAGRPMPTAPALTRLGPALQTRALDPGRSIFKPIKTIKNARGLELGEIWDCRAGGDRWFEALIFQPDGSKKKLGRFSDQAEAAKAIVAATARKAA
jgi:hypothetical protein